MINVNGPLITFLQVMEHSFMYSVKLIKKKKVVSSKSSRNSLAQFTEITTVKEEMYIDILCRLRDAV